MRVLVAAIIALACVLGLAAATLYTYGKGGYGMRYGKGGYGKGGYAGVLPMHPYGFGGGFGGGYGGGSGSGSSLGLIGLVFLLVIILPLLFNTGSSITVVNASSS